MTSKARVYAGACGFTSIIKVKRLDKVHVNVEIISACKMLREMNEDLKELDWRKNIFCRIVDSVIYKSASTHLKHTDCPVPSAIIKNIQMELGGMLPTEVNMKFEQTDDETV